MTDKESMKQALEALEGIHPGNMTPMAEEYWNKAIAALKERLAQPEQEQEPVAWQIETYIAGVWSPMGNPQRNKNRAENLSNNPSIPKENQRIIPLYTHPPQRTWVGLNDDEIDYLIYLAYTGDEEFVRTIEAKLKEKNLPCIKPEWIGLTEKEHTEIAIECGCMSADWVFYGAAVERKVKERNT
jgi:hypothetical protein